MPVPSTDATALATPPPKRKTLGRKAPHSSPATSASSAASPSQLLKTRSANEAVLSPRLRGLADPYPRYSPRKRLSADFSDGTYSAESGADSPKSEKGGWRIHAAVNGPFLTGPLAKDFAARLEELRSPRNNVTKKLNEEDLDNNGLLLFPIVPDFVPPAITPEVFQASIQPAAQSQPQPEPDLVAPLAQEETCQYPAATEQTYAPEAAWDASAQQQQDYYYSEQQYSEQQYNAEHYNAEQYNAEQYTAEQYSGEQYNGEQYTAEQQSYYYNNGYDQQYYATEGYNYQQPYEEYTAPAEQVPAEETVMAPLSDEAFPPLPSQNATSEVSVNQVAEVETVTAAPSPPSPPRSPVQRPRAPSYAEVVTGAAHVSTTPAVAESGQKKAPAKSTFAAFDQLSDSIAESMSKVLAKSGNNNKSHAEVEFSCLIHRIQTQLKLMGRVSNSLHLKQMKTLHKLQQTEIEKLSVEATNMQLMARVQKYELEQQELKNQLAAALEAKDVRLRDALDQLTHRLDSLKNSTDASTSKLASQIDAIRNSSSPDDLEKRVEEIGEVLDHLIENQQDKGTSASAPKLTRRSSKSDGRRQSVGSWKAIALYAIVVWAASLCGVWVGVKYAGVVQTPVVAHVEAPQSVVQPISESRSITEEMAAVTIVEEAAPVFEEVAPVIEEVAPVFEEVAPVVEEEAIAVEEEAAVADSVLPVAENVAPIVETVVPPVSEEVKSVVDSSPIVIEETTDSEVNAEDQHEETTTLVEELHEVEIVDISGDISETNVIAEVEAISEPVFVPEVVVITTPVEPVVELVDEPVPASDVSVTVAPQSVAHFSPSCFSCPSDHSMLASFFCEMLSEVATVVASAPEIVEEVPEQVTEIAEPVEDMPEMVVDLTASAMVEPTLEVSESIVEVAESSAEVAPPTAEVDEVEASTSVVIERVSIPTDVCSPLAHALYVWCPSLFDMSPAERELTSGPLSDLARALTSLSSHILSEHSSTSVDDVNEESTFEIIEEVHESASPVIVDELVEVTEPAVEVTGPAEVDEVDDTSDSTVVVAEADVAEEVVASAEVVEAFAAEAEPASIETVVEATEVAEPIEVTAPVEDIMVTEEDVEAPVAEEIVLEQNNRWMVEQFLINVGAMSGTAEPTTLVEASIPESDVAEISTPVWSLVEEPEEPTHTNTSDIVETVQLSASLAVEVEETTDAPVVVEAEETVDSAEIVEVKSVEIVSAVVEESAPVLAEPVTELMNESQPAACPLESCPLFETSMDKAEFANSSAVAFVVADEASNEEASTSAPVGTTPVLDLKSLVLTAL